MSDVNPINVNHHFTQAMASASPTPAAPAAPSQKLLLKTSDASCFYLMSPIDRSLATTTGGEDGCSACEKSLSTYRVFL